MGIEAVALLEVLNWKHIGGGGTGGAGAATAKASSPQYKTPACSLARGAEEMALPQVSLQSRAQLSRPCVSRVCPGEHSHLLARIGSSCRLWDSQEAEIQENSVL